MSSDYTSIAEDLASQGYVVVSMDAPYRTVITAFPDGRVAYRNTQSDFDSMPYAIGGEICDSGDGSLDRGFRVRSPAVAGVKCEGPRRAIQGQA